MSPTTKQIKDRFFLYNHGLNFHWLSSLVDLQSRLDSTRYAVNLNNPDWILDFVGKRSHLIPST